MSSPRGFIKELTSRLSLHDHHGHHHHRHRSADGAPDDPARPAGLSDTSTSASSATTPMRLSLSSQRPSRLSGDGRRSVDLQRSKSDKSHAHSRASSRPRAPHTTRPSLETSRGQPQTLPHSNLRPEPHHHTRHSADLLIMSPLTLTSLDPPALHALEPTSASAPAASTYSLAPSGLPIPALTPMPAQARASTMAPGPATVSALAASASAPEPVVPAYPASLNPFSDAAALSLGTDDGDSEQLGLGQVGTTRPSTPPPRRLSLSVPLDLPDLAPPAVTPSAPAESEASDPEPESPPTPGAVPPNPFGENNNRPVVKFGTASLNVFDWMSLGPKEWLSDNVLAFWFALIEAQLAERDPATAGRHTVTRAALWPPSLVELLTALPQALPRKDACALFPPLAPVVVLPLNNGYSRKSCTAPEPGKSTHWSVLIITRADEGRKAWARHYDSHAPMNTAVARRVWALWCRIYAPNLTAPVRRMESASELAPQRNAWDCGLYVLGVTGELLLASSPHPRSAAQTTRTIHPDDVARYRTEVHRWLERWQGFSCARQQAATWAQVVRAVGPMPMLVSPSPDRAPKSSI